MDGSEFFKPESMYATMDWNFPIWYFLSVALCESRYIFAFGPSWIPFNSFSQMFIHSAFLWWTLHSHILLQNRFVSLASGCWYVFAYYYYCSFEFFSSVLTDGLSRMSEWQQVSSGPQDSSQYSDRPPQWCSLDGLGLSSDFQLFQPSFQTFEDPSNQTSYNWYHRYLHVP